MARTRCEVILLQRIPHAGACWTAVFDGPDD